MKALKHPNIVGFEDDFKDKKMRWNIVMEYVDDGTLQRAIDERSRDQRPFSEDEILNMFTQLCLAVKNCHDRKLLHRDIKAENVLLTRRGICKLGDFGIAKVLA